MYDLKRQLFEEALDSEILILNVFHCQWKRAAIAPCLKKSKCVEVLQNSTLKIAIIQFVKI